MLRSPRPGSLIAHIRRAWRRSLQIRIVTITVATTSAVMLAFGLIVGSLITNGLIETKEAAAKATVEKNSERAVELLESQISGDGPHAQPRGWREDGDHARAG